MKLGEWYEDTGLWLGVGFGVFILVAFGATINANIKHREELKANGCELFFEQPTGKRVYCGKACWRDEKLSMYTCSNGTRVEIDGEVVGTAERK